jgi:hypothetical protein
MKKINKNNMQNDEADEEQQLASDCGEESE